jgi:hypothetical protein
LDILKLLSSLATEKHDNMVLIGSLQKWMLEAKYAEYAQEGDRMGQ